MAVCKKTTLLNDATLMMLIMWVVEILITTFLIQYAWNYVLVGKDNKKGPALKADSVNEISFMDAFLLSVSVKLLVFGMEGLKDFL